MSDLAKVFTYGTLEFPEILEAVSGGVFSATEAVLHGYARYALVGRDFPGIIEKPGTSTHGTLFCGIDAEALKRIDEFESDFYERLALRVTTSIGSSDAYVYVIPELHRSIVTDQPWNKTEFERLYLSEYL